MKDFCKHCVWELANRNAFGIRGVSLTQEVRLELTLKDMKTEYDKFVAANKDMISTPIQQLTPEMFGDNSVRCSALKAAETKGFFFFISGHSSSTRRGTSRMVLYGSGVHIQFSASWIFSKKLLYVLHLLNSRNTGGVFGGVSV